MIIGMAINSNKTIKIKEIIKNPSQWNHDKMTFPKKITLLVTIPTIDCSYIHSVYDFNLNDVQQTDEVWSGILHLVSLLSWLILDFNIEM